MKSGIIFSGYGSQWVGMGKELYDRERVVQEYFEEAATCLNLNFVKLCFASSDADLAKISHAYTSLFLLGACSAGLLRSRGIPFELVGGTDMIGWYSALFAAESISLPDGLYILNKWAQLYEEFLITAHVGGLLITGMPLKRVEEYVAPYPELAIARTDLTAIMVTGSLAQLEELEAELRAVKRVKVRQADLGMGLHMEVAEQLGQQLASYLEKIDLKAPKVPLISPVTGRIITSVHQIHAVVQQLVMRPLAIDKVIKKLCKLPLLYVAVPSHKTKELLVDCRAKAGFAPESLVTMETVAEFDALVAAVTPPISETSQESSPTISEESSYDANQKQ